MSNILGFYLSFEIKLILDKGLCHLESSFGVHGIPHLSFFFSILRIVERKIYTVYYRNYAFCIFCNLGGDMYTAVTFIHINPF